MSKLSLKYNKSNLINKPYSLYEYIAIFLAVKIFHASFNNNTPKTEHKFNVEKNHFEFILNILNLLDIEFDFYKNLGMFVIKKVHIYQIGSNEEEHDFFNKKKYNQKDTNTKNILSFFDAINVKIKIKFYIALIEEYYFVLVHARNGITNIDQTRNLSINELNDILVTYEKFKPRI